MNKLKRSLSRKNVIKIDQPSNDLPTICTQIGIIGNGRLGQQLRSYFKSFAGYCQIRITKKLDLKLPPLISLKEPVVLLPMGTIKVYNPRSASSIASLSNLLFICVKPAQVKEVFNEISGSLKPNTVIISMAAGVKHQLLNKYLEPLDQLPKGIFIYRGMTDIASLNIENKLKTFFYFGSNEINKDLYPDLKPFTNKLVRVNESQLELLTVVQACGIAYWGKLFKAYQSAVAEMLKDEFENSSSQLITEMVFFSGAQWLLSRHNPDILIEKVASPGGLTDA